MKLHTFQSGKEPDVFGFTADETAMNLPADLAPWTPSVSSTPMQATAGADDPIAAVVERDGFYLARSETLPKQAGIPGVS